MSNVATKRAREDDGAAGTEEDRRAYTDECNEIAFSELDFACASPCKEEARKILEHFLRVLQTTRWNALCVALKTANTVLNMTDGSGAVSKCFSSTEKRRAMLKEYIKFMFLLYLYDPTATETRPALSPPLQVDWVWHMHLLIPTHYSEFCSNLFGVGKIVHHEPGTSEAESTHPTPGFDDHYIRAQRAYERYTQVFEKSSAFDLWAASVGALPIGDEMMLLATMNSKNAAEIMCAAENIAIMLTRNLEFQDGDIDISDGHTKIQVFVKTLSGQTITINEICTTKMTVRNLKRKIFEKEGIPPKRQRLIFAGKQLEDEAMLCAYNLEARNTIHMAMRLGGC
jgi:large subunit ribosomal protein L40e